MATPGDARSALVAVSDNSWEEKDIIKSYTTHEREILVDVNNALVAASSAFLFYAESLANAAAKLRTLAKEEKS